MASGGGAHSPAWREPRDGFVPRTAATPMHLIPPTMSKAPLSLVHFPSLAVILMGDFIKTLHVARPSSPLAKKTWSILAYLFLALSCYASNPSYLHLGALLQLVIVPASPLTWGFSRRPTISPAWLACLGKEAGQEGARPRLHLGNKRVYLALALI